MRLHLTALIAATMLCVSVLLQAQGWVLQRTLRGTPNAVLVRGERVLAVGDDAPPQATIEAFGLPKDAAAMLQYAPRAHVVMSANRTQLGRITVISSDGGHRSRYEPLNRSWSVEIPGLPEFFVSDNGATVVAAALDIHNQADTLISVYNNKGVLVGGIQRPRVKRVRLSSNGTVLVVAGDAGVYVFAVRDSGITQIGEMPPAAAVELSPRGDWLARAVADGVALHKVANGRFADAVETTVKMGVPKAIRFNEQSTHLALADAEFVRLFELQRRQQVWSVPSGALVTGLDVSGDASIIGVAAVKVISPRTRTSAGAATADVRLLSQDGSVVAHQPLPGESWSTQSPRVTFFDRGRRLLIESTTDVFTLSRRER